MIARKKAFIVFIILLSVVSYIYYAANVKNHQQLNYKIQFAYPVISINPTIYDDWQSVFIGNHIYPRLLPENNQPNIPYITSQLNIHCLSPYSPHVSNLCKTVKLTFKPASFIDCLGRQYNIADIEKEFFNLLTTTGWVVPNWQKCNEGKGIICITGKYLPDQIRRFRSTFFRFGWSKAIKQDTVFGAGPYCLYGNFDSDGKIFSGMLKPMIKNLPLPSIAFHTSQASEKYFHLAIYGNSKLLSKNRKNISVHTPLAYYVITNPSLNQYNLPWNQSSIRYIIHQYLFKIGLCFQNIPTFLKFAPEGKALEKKRNIKWMGYLTFALPNYLPDCQQLANKLNKIWKISQTKAICTDIISYVYQNTINKKNGWDGFLVGISASDTSRDSLRYQYFSSDIPKSWLYPYPRPEELFYRVGIGQTIVTVDGKKICDIKPNPLGLGNIFITDLIQCNK